MGLLCSTILVCGWLVCNGCCGFLLFLVLLWEGEKESGKCGMTHHVVPPFFIFWKCFDWKKCWLGVVLFLDSTHNCQKMSCSLKIIIRGCCCWPESEASNYYTGLLQMNSIQFINSIIMPRCQVGFGVGLASSKIVVVVGNISGWLCGVSSS